jgi:hypothetical protein
MRQITHSKDTPAWELGEKIMTRLIHVSEKTARVRALFPENAEINVWHELQNGFGGMLLANGSIDIRHKVKLTASDESHVWRIDRITPKGNERFIGYRSLTTVEAAIY